MFAVNVTGLRELGVALQGLSDKLAKTELARATLASAKVGMEDARQRAPVRSGNLQEHIVTFRRSADANSAHYAVGVRPIRLNSKMRKVLSILHKDSGRRTSVEGDPFYWRFLEFGTSRMPPHPFMRPAFEESKTAMIDMFKSTLTDGLARIASEVNR